MEVKLSVALPALVTVTDWAGDVIDCTMLPKFSDVGLSCTIGPLPEPEKDAVCVAALLVTLNDPLRVPAKVGVKPTLMVHVPTAANVAGQLLVCEKSPVAAPTR